MAKNKPKLQYRTRNAGERTSLSAVLTANGFTHVGEDGTFEEKKILVIDNTLKTFGFIDKKDAKHKDINLSMILSNEYKIKREINRVYIGYIAGYSAHMTTEGATFGCQTVSFENVEKIYNEMLKMKAEIAKGEYEEL